MWFFFQGGMHGRTGARGCGILAVAENGITKLMDQLVMGAQLGSTLVHRTHVEFVLPFRFWGLLALCFVSRLDSVSIRCKRATNDLVVRTVWIKPGQKWWRQRRFCNRIASVVNALTLVTLVWHTRDSRLRWVSALGLICFSWFSFLVDSRAFVWLFYFHNAVASIHSSIGTSIGWHEKWNSAFVLHRREIGKQTFAFRFTNGYSVFWRSFFRFVSIQNAKTNPF